MHHMSTIERVASSMSASSAAANKLRRVTSSATVADFAAAAADSAEAPGPVVARRESCFGV